MDLVIYRVKSNVYRHSDELASAYWPDWSVSKISHE